VKHFICNVIRGIDITMTILEYGLAFFIGTLWGSFFYTLALRYTGGMFKENPWKALISSSKCPGCSTRISPLYLIPLLGYIILRAKCRKCGWKIPAAYPLAEIGYGLLLSWIASIHGITVYTAVTFLLIGLAVSISIIDIKSMIIPNSLVITFIFISIYPILLHFDIWNNFHGLALMAGVFIVILLVFPGSFGGGDVKLAAAMGLLAGLELSIVILETALITGALTGAAYGIITRKGLKTKIPFAPFLTAGLVAAMLYGREIVLLYYRTMY